MLPRPTARLRLRPWRDADLAPFAALNADPEVMRWFPSTLTRDQSDQLAGRIRARLAADGFGLWAVEVAASRAFIGFVGLAPVTFEAGFTPATEIGWRLARRHWGHGYAPEAARSALRYAFDELRVPEVVSFTTVRNRASRRVMVKIGMRHHPDDDFDHPRLEPGHPLRAHVLYRITTDNPGHV